MDRESEGTAPRSSPQVAVFELPEAGIVIPAFWVVDAVNDQLSSEVALERLELPTRGLGRRRACALWPGSPFPPDAGVIVCS